MAVTGPVASNREITSYESASRNEGGDVDIDRIILTVAVGIFEERVAVAEDADFGIGNRINWRTNATASAHARVQGASLKRSAGHRV